MSKYYVVWRGHSPGIYENWNACKAQVKGFKYSYYRVFPTFKSANEAFGLSLTEFKRRQQFKENTFNLRPNSIVVSSKYEEKNMETVFTAFKVGDPPEILFRTAICGKSTHNIVQFLALAASIKYCYENGLKSPIYSDNPVALKWIRDRKINSQVIRSDRNQEVFDLVDEAIYWLNCNSYNNQLIEWDVEKHGYLPRLKMD